MKNNPYYTIWFRPGPTVEACLRQKKGHVVHVPLIIAAISAAWGNDIAGLFGYGWPETLIITFIVSVFAYLLIGYFVPWWTLLFGKIWKGKGKFRQMQLVIGLANIPMVFVLLYQIMALAGGEAIVDERVSYAVQFITWIFYVRTLIVGTAKIQGFWYGLALVNILLSLLPFFIIRLMMR
ncbi:MAG: hypothetical protein OEY51_04725 [Cyclobacteriaceae bacterium]|nr:hypothetical protein [Cyclobacteriaceae bacterium]